ncbi:MAG: PAS domain-containing protein [Pseudomonadota bacterium]
MSAPSFTRPGPKVEAVRLRLRVAELERKLEEQARANNGPHGPRDGDLADLSRPALDSLAIQVAVLDETGAIRHVNEAWSSRAEARDALPLGAGFLESFEPDGGDAETKRLLAEGLAAVISGEKNSFSVEYSRVRQGQARWFHVRGAGLPGGGPAGVVISRADVTEHRLMEDGLRDKERRLRFVGENMPALLEAFDENGSLLAWNKEAEKVTGRKAEEVVGSPRGMEILYPDPRVRRAIIKGIKDRGLDFSDREWPVTCRDGREKIISWFNISKYFPIPGWFSWAIGFDVTDRKKAELERRETQKRFTLFMNNLPGPASIKNRDGRYVLANAFYETLLGLDDYRAVIGKRDADIFPENFSSQNEKNDLAVLNEARPLEFVETTPGAEGPRHWLCIKFPLFQDDGPMLIGSVAVEITDRIRAERELEIGRKELRLKAENLKEVNTALKVLLDRRENEKNRQIADMTSTLEKLVFPYLKRLGTSNLDKDQMNFLSIVETNLREIASPFAGRLDSLEDRLTPAELEVAELLRQGKTSDEIAELLHTSVHTVSSHRHGIRRKLGLLNKRVNLKSHLRSFG